MSQTEETCHWLLSATRPAPVYEGASPSEFFAHLLCVYILAHRICLYVLEVVLHKWIEEL